MEVYPVVSRPVLRAMELFRVDFVCDVIFDFPVADMKYSDKQLKGERAYIWLLTTGYSPSNGNVTHQDPENTGHMISIVKSRKLEINVCMLVFCPLL